MNRISTRRFTLERATMRTFELRVYKLRTKEALDFYREEIDPRHLNSFPLFGIEAHGFWTAKEDVEPRLFVLASYRSAFPGGMSQEFRAKRQPQALGQCLRSLTLS